jgi:hypothetical protein
MSNQISLALIGATELEPRRIVFADSSSELNYSDSPNDPVAGVTSEFAEVGEPCTIITSGDFVVASSGAINAGDPIIADTNGFAASGGSTTDGWFAGRALTEAVGGRVRIQVAPWFIPTPAP